MIFKGINSKNIDGLIICKEPPISSSEMRIQEIEIEGRDGTLIEKLGYKSRTKSVEIGINKSVNINRIIEYFSGEGDLTFDSELDKVYKATIYKAFDLEKLLKFKKGIVEFYCQPFKYKRNDNYIVANSSIINEGNVYSKPVIRLEKKTTSTIDITINNIRFQYEFKTNDTYVEIDCETMEVEYEGLNRSRNLTIGYKFPVLKSGENEVIIRSGDAILKVKRKDRWL